MELFESICYVHLVASNLPTHLTTGGLNGNRTINPTIPTGIDLAAEYLRLINGASLLLDYGLTSLESRGKSRVDDLRVAVALTTARLTSEQARYAVSYAAAQLEPSVYETLGSELRYINANLPGDGSFILDEKVKIEAAEDAKTGKDSLDDLLGNWLPGWLKSSLRVLSELLSIAFKAQPTP